jgi:hypothetical protein
MLRAVAQMSQLVFQPALDPFHAVFRFLRLFPIVASAALSRDHARILDYYLLFPFRIRSMRLAPAHQKFKRLSETYAHLKPYGEQPDGPLIFERMEPMQTAALETLASRGFLDLKALQSDEIKATTKVIPDELAARVHALNSQQSDLLEFLVVLAQNYDLSGKDGLKARSELLEYRYDAV